MYRRGSSSPASSSVAQRRTRLDLVPGARALALAAALGAGCSGRTAPSKPANLGVSATPAAEEPADSVPAPSHAAGGCIVTETKLDGLVQLRLEAGGTSLAILRDASARLDLGNDPAFVELERGGITLRTPYDSEERPLHLRRALALGGVLTPKPGATISLLNAAAEGQEILFSCGVELGHAVIDQLVACADITLNTQDYQVNGEAENEGTPVQLTGAVEVSVAPGETPTLQLYDRDIVADELVRRGGYVKIRVDTPTELLLGWVPEGAIGEEVGTLRGSHAVGKAVAAGQMRSQSHTVYRTCTRDLTLFAELEGRVGEVGVARAGTPFELVTRVERGVAPGYSVVDFWQNWIIQRKGMRFVVASIDTKDCSVAR